MATRAVAGRRTGIIEVTLYNGRREPFSDAAVDLTFWDGRPLSERRTRHVSGVRGNPIRIQDLPLFDNLGDNYTVVVSARGHNNTGYFPVKIRPGEAVNVDLMLVPKNAGFNFRAARWEALEQAAQNGDPASIQARLFAIVSRANSHAGARERYEQFLETRNLPAAAFLNMAEAMRLLKLPGGRDALSYLVEPFWGTDATGKEYLRQDRFFAWADAGLLDQAREANSQGLLSEESPKLHPGATCSYKEQRFEVANVQLTFHENDRETVEAGGRPVNCIKLEVDMDYYRDRLAHGLLEVFPNFFGTRTDPRRIYALRWMAGRRMGENFAPPITLEA